MKKNVLLLALFVCSWNLWSQDQGPWELVYHNDKSGKALVGDIQTLIEDVRKGERVRIYWFFQHPTDKTIKVEHLTEAKFLTVLSDSVVLAQIDPIIGQSPDFVAQRIDLKENLEWSFIAASNGKCDTMTRNSATGEIVEHRPRAFEIKWFVQR
ncbi:hypothetical protein WIW50_07575 [Flavobacteriaceae bacterium 3-367]